MKPYAILLIIITVINSMKIYRQYSNETIHVIDQIVINDSTPAPIFDIPPPISDFYPTESNTTNTTDSNKIQHDGRDTLDDTKKQNDIKDSSEDNKPDSNGMIKPIIVSKLCLK